jgi:hypothetical protein
MISPIEKNDMKGSVLLESLLATVILSFGLTFVIGSFLGSFRVLQDNRDYLDAVFLLENEIHHIKQNLPRATAADRSDHSSQSGPFRYQLQMTDAGAGGTLHEAVATVAWTGRGHKRISAATYVFDRE